jgi:hypothetical protein
MSQAFQWIWWTGTLLLAALVFRGFKLRLQYPWFLGYLCIVLLNTILAAMFYKHPQMYTKFYWYWSQPSSLLSGCGVLWELQARMLERHPGVRRFARALLPILLGLISLSVVNTLLTQSFEAFTRAMIDLEMNVRVLQAAYLAGLAGLALYYRVRISSHLNGILLGYSILTTAGIACLVLANWVGQSFYKYWVVIQPVAYCMALLIWCFYLWRADRAPAAPQADEEEYAQTYGRALNACSRMLNQLTQVLRSTE